MYLSGFLCLLSLSAPISAVASHPSLPNQDDLIAEIDSPLRRELENSQNDGIELGPFNRKLLSSLENITPRPAPVSIADAIDRLKSMREKTDVTGYIEAATNIISQGLATNNLEALLTGFKKVNNPNNVNKREPKETIYPKKSPQDAPYSQTEAELRRQIFIPNTFTYGKKTPVILVPGTGERGGNSFVGNFFKTLRDKSYADIVWINPVGYQLADAQENGENVAYAINYISGICNNQNVTLLGWSQGSMSMQWAVKWWPSARKLVSGVVTFSGDYDGSLDANLLDPLPVVPLPPAIIQQKIDSNFVKALKSNDGDSAYVPTTTIYSSFFDEIVIPQHGKAASAYINDVRGVGVSNNDIQHVCSRTTLAGVFVDHESLLFNSLTFALVEDALTNGSPAQRSRLNLTAVCNQLAAPGLTVDDIVTTESSIPFAVAQIALYHPKVLVEPKIKPYAR